MTVAIGTYVSVTTLKSRLGITDTTDDARATAVCEQVNSYIESVTRRTIGPLTAGTVTFDIPQVSTVLYVPQGVRGVTSLLVADSTGATQGTVASGDYFLRPLRPTPGWPYTEIHISDVPTGSITQFSPGYAVVSVIGTFGWAETPEDLEDVAETIAVRAWHASEAGQSDVVGTDEMGRPVVSRYLSARDRQTLWRYAAPPTAA